MMQHWTIEHTLAVAAVAGCLMISWCAYLDMNRTPEAVCAAKDRPTEFCQKLVERMGVK